MTICILVLLEGGLGRGRVSVVHGRRRKRSSGVSAHVWAISRYLPAPAHGSALHTGSGASRSPRHQLLLPDVPRALSQRPAYMPHGNALPSPSP